MSLDTEEMAGQIKVSWSQSTGATGYKVQWKSGSEDWDASARQQTVSGGGTLTTAVTGLTGGTEYSIRVIATKTGADDSDPSDVATATAPTAGPTAPTNVRVVPAGDGLLVTWTPSVSTDTVGYNIWWGTESARETRRWRPTGFFPNQFISGLTAGTTYKVKVSAWTATDAAQGFSSEVTATPLASQAGSVTGVSVGSTTDRQIDVSWAAVTGADGYEVYYTKLAIERTWPWLFHSHGPKTVSGGATTSAALTSGDGIEAGGRYEVWVLATKSGAARSALGDEQSGNNDVARRARTPLATLTTGEVQVKPVSYTSDELQVTWPVVAGAASYVLQWKTGTGSSYGTTDRANPTGTSHTIAGLSAGTDYDVKVTVIRTGSLENPDGESVEAAGATNPQFSGLSVVAPPGEDQALSASWTVLDGATGYLVQWKLASATEYSSDDSYELQAGTASVRISPSAPNALSPNTPYIVRVTAQHQESADSTEYLGDAQEATVRTNTVIANLVVGPVYESSTQLRVSWDADTAADGYDIYWALKANHWSRNDCIPTNADNTHCYSSAVLATGTSHVVTGLEADSPYYVYVRQRYVRPTNGDKYYGNGVKLEAPVKTNGPLKGLSVTAPGSDKPTELSVAWTADPRARAYLVQWKQASDSAYSDTNQHVVNKVGDQAPATSYTITGLNQRTVYDVKVSVIVFSDSSNPDGQSAVESARTYTVLTPLTGLSVTPHPGLPTAIRVSWSAVSGAAGYRVDWKLDSDGAFPEANSAEIAAGTLKHDITGLTATTAYEVKVTARVTLAGTVQDGDSDRATATTHALLTGLEVQHVVGTYSVLYVTWDSLEDANHYLVQHKQTSAETFSSPVRVTTAHEIENLLELTSYDVRVTAVDTDTDPHTILGVAEATGTTKSAPDVSPAFAANASIANQSYTLNEAVSPLTLPQASGGNGALTYSITPALPSGLSFDPATRILSGRPTARKTPTTYTYKVTDSDASSPDSVELNFTISVSAHRQHHLVDDVMIVGWTPSEDSGVTGYVIQWKSGDQQYSTTERSHTAGPDDTSYEISDLPLGVYTVKVTQQGGAEDGTAFEETVTLHGWPGVVYVDPVAGDARAIDVEWEEVSTAAGYVIQWKLASADSYPVANRASVTAGSLNYRTATDGHTGETVQYPIHRVSGLQPNTKYEARVIVYTAAGSADSPDGLSHENLGTTHGELTGLTVSAVDGETTKLDVSWNAPDTSVARFDARGYRVQWKTGSGEYPEANKAEVTSGTSHQITGLTAGAEYTVRVTVLGDWSGIHYDGDADEASGTTNAQGTGQGQGSAPPGEPEWREATDTAVLEGLSVNSVSGKPTQLAVTWEAVQDAARYDVRWKTGSGDYGDAQQTTTNSYTVTGLSPNTSYTVNVAALDGDNSLLAEATASGSTDQQQSDSIPAISFVIYHDPNAGNAAVDRYNQGVKVLKDASISYSEVKGEVQDDVDGLAGVTDSVLPRFFLGDPTGEGWVSKPGENNGGLRWLKEKISEMSGAGAYAPAESAAISGLTVSPVASETTKLAVSWKAVTDADQYLVQWKTGADDYNSGDTATTNSHPVTGLTAGTTYTVQVTATDTDADTDAELAVGEASGSTLAAMGTVTVSAVTDSSDSLDVSWVAVNGAVGYAVEYKTSGGSYSAVTRSDATATSERITGLEAETAYTVRVTARHTIAGLEANGDSAEGSGTTNAAPAQDPPAQDSPANSPASGAPTINGTAQVGETLTADTSGISDADGLTNASFSYQWLADGSDISGATGSSYAPVAADVGKALSVRVSFTDDAGNAESLTSEATDAVKAEDPPEEEAAAVSFVIYHDPNAGDEAVDRYNQGVKLLKDANISYSEVKGDVQEDVDSLAGVTGSVIPRFFLGDPTEEGWVSETKVNNGGLRWLKGKVAELTSG